MCLHIKHHSSSGNIQNPKKKLEHEKNCSNSGIWDIGKKWILNTIRTKKCKNASSSWMQMDIPLPIFAVYFEYKRESFKLVSGWFW